MKNYQSFVDALSDLRKRGYDEDFETDTFCLYCGDLDIRLYPEVFKVDEVYRFEGSPGDSDVVYAISSCTGAKGISVDANADHSNAEMPPGPGAQQTIPGP